MPWMGTDMAFTAVGIYSGCFCVNIFSSACRFQATSSVQEIYLRKTKDPLFFLHRRDSDEEKVVRSFIVEKIDSPAQF